MVRDRLRHCVSPRGRRRVAAGAVSAYCAETGLQCPSSTADPGVVVDAGCFTEPRSRVGGQQCPCRHHVDGRVADPIRSKSITADNAPRSADRFIGNRSPWIHVERRCDIAASALSQTAVANASSTISSAPSARISERISLSRPTPRIHRNTAHGRGNTSAGAPAATGIGTDNGSCEASHGSQLSPCRPPPPIRDGGEDAPPGHRRGGTTRCRAGGRSLRDRSVNPLRELLIQQLEHHGYGHAQLVGVHRRTVPVQRLTV